MSVCALTLHLQKTKKSLFVVSKSQEVKVVSVLLITVEVPRGGIYIHCFHHIPFSLFLGIGATVRTHRDLVSNVSIYKKVKIIFYTYICQYLLL